MMLDIFTRYTPFILLGIGSITLLIALFWSPAKNKLKETGIPVDGIIFKQEAGGSHLTDTYSSVNDKITVRFVTLDEKWITGEIQQGFQFFFSGQYKDGEAVKVYYDQNDPSSFYVDSKQSELLGRLVMGVAGLLVILFGLYKLFA